MESALSQVHKPDDVHESAKENTEDGVGLASVDESLLTQSTSSTKTCDDSLRDNTDDCHSKAIEKDEEELSLTRKILRRFSGRPGIILAITASISFSAMGTFVDAVASRMNGFQLTSMMVPVVIVGSTCLLVINDISFPRDIKQYLWLLPSGIALSCLNVSLAYSFKYMPLADTLTISHVSIIFVGVLSWAILREPFRIPDFIFAVIAIGGIICICRPSFIFGDAEELEGRNSLLGSVFALVAALVKSVMFVLVRKQSTIGVHPYISSFFNCVIVEITTISMCSIFSLWQCVKLQEWLFTLGAGLAYFCAQVTLYLALARESATVVSVIVVFELVFAFIWQVIFFPVIPLWTSPIGALLVMISCIGTAVMRPNKKPSPKEILEE